MGGPLYKMYVVLMVTMFVISGCATQAKTSLFEKLGGERNMQAIVDSLITEIANDSQVFTYFADTKVSRFRQQLYDHLCAVTDGPCTYTGDDMKDVHAGMKITESDFNHIVELLIIAMDKNQIKQTTQNLLLARLAPMRPSIIHQ